MRHPFADKNQKDVNTSTRSTQGGMSRGHGKPDLHLGYALQASSCISRACGGANFLSQAGTLLQKEVKIKRL